mgnify:CR=1 FL=1
MRRRRKAPDQQEQQHRAGHHGGPRVREIGEAVSQHPRQQGHAAGDDVTAALHKGQQPAGLRGLVDVIEGHDQGQGKQGADAQAEQQAGGQRERLGLSLIHI